MSIQVNIKKGIYRGEAISGTFALVRAYNPSGANGGFVTIKNPNPNTAKKHPPVQRVHVDNGDFELIGADGATLEAHVTVADVNGTGILSASTDYEKVFTEGESEQEAMVRIDETFLMLDKITDACAKGTIRGLVVSGPPGIGKSFGVEKQLDAANLFRTVKGQDPKFEIVSGGVSTIGLYQKLYHNRHKENVLVFDDSDGVLFDEESLTLLKGALNSGDRRRICWNKESRVLSMEDIPEAFDFEGSVIFLSNVDFEASIARGSRISDHLAAIMSRCHYLDLEIGSIRDKLLVIKLRLQQGMLAPFNFEPEQEAAILDFVVSNHEYLREISLRMVKKIADFVTADPLEWKDMAEATCLQREAKFKRLLAKRAEAKRRGVATQDV